MSSEIVISSAIRDASYKCLKAFASILDAATSESTKINQEILEDQHARFRIWAGTLGVFSSPHLSADFRLRYSQDTRNLIRKLLRRLERNLKWLSLQATPIHSHDQHESTNEEDESSSDSSFWLSDDPGLSEAKRKKAGTGASDDRRLKVVDETITDLLKLTPIIETTLSNEDEEVARWAQDEGSRLVNELQGFKKEMQEFLTTRFPRLDPSLKDRLLETSLRRRKKLIYRRNLRFRFEPGSESTFLLKEQSSGLKPRLLSMAQSVQSLLDRSTLSVDHVRIPPPPRASLGSAKPVCPYCALPLENEIVEASDRMPWKLHVMWDIRPYVCLFKECELSLQQYKTRDDWVNHMASQHTRAWACQAKGHESYVFPTSAELESHICKEHSDSVSPTDVTFMARRGSKPAPDTFAALAAGFEAPRTDIVSACPFCDDPETRIQLDNAGVISTFPEKSRQKISDHIAEHLEIIALESLPKRNDVVDAVLMRVLLVILFLVRILFFIIYMIERMEGTAEHGVQEIFRRRRGEMDVDVDLIGWPGTEAKFLGIIRNAIQGTSMELFFGPDSNFVAELAKKAASLADDPSTPLYSTDLLPKVAQVTMHQQVLYCDDSRSMMYENCWGFQKNLMLRIARATTRILPGDEGVYLRYINQEAPNSNSLKFEDLLYIVENLEFEQRFNTAIGTKLKRKVLEPLVYSKLPNDIKRPLLVSIIIGGSGGRPRQELKSTFVDAIAECGEILEAAGLPRETVKFIVGQVGSSTSATQFLHDISNDPRIADVVAVASERLDKKLLKLGSDWKIDEWLIETLYAPILKSQGKKNH